MCLETTGFALKFDREPKISPHFGVYQVYGLGASSKKQHCGEGGDVWGGVWVERQRGVTVHAEGT